MDLFEYALTPDPDALQDGDTIPIRLELKRRLHPDRQAPTTQTESDDNPWIVVDQYDFTIDIFTLQDGDTYDAIRDQLRQMDTLERTEPLNAQNLRPFTKPGSVLEPTPSSFQLNSLGHPNILGLDNNLPNVAAYQVHNIYQKHFNRDLARPWN